MKKIKVTHIWKDFDTYNGMVEILLFIAKYHNRELFNLGACVFNDHGGEHSRRFEELGGKVYNLNCGYGLRGHIKFLPRLKDFLLEQRPDIVVTHDRRANLFGILAANQAKIPVIISMETTLKDSATSRIKILRDRALHPILLLMVWSSDTFVCTSACIRRQWMRKSCLSKFRVFYPPFNLEKYNSVVSHPGNSDRSKAYPTLGYVGRLSEEKGLHYLIRAMARVCCRFPGVKLLVAGSGVMENSFKSLAKTEKVADAINFLGFQDNPFRIMEQIDLLILPSRTEGCPIVVIEAMAMGVPVIASNVGGVPELVTNDVGTLVPPKDAEALAKSITNLLEQPELMRKMGEAAHKRAFTYFQPLEFVRQFEKLYIELLEKKINGKFMS